MNSTPSVGEKLRSPFSSMSMQGSSVPPDTTIGHLQYSPTTDARRVPSFEVINSAPSPPNPGGLNLSARQSTGEVPPAKQSRHSPNVYGTKSPPSLHLSSAVDQQLQLERSSRSSGVSKTPEIANSPPFKEDEGNSGRMFQVYYFELSSTIYSTHHKKETYLWFTWILCPVLSRLLNSTPLKMYDTFQFIIEVIVCLMKFPLKLILI